MSLRRPRFDAAFGTGTGPLLPTHTSASLSAPAAAADDAAHLHHHHHLLHPHYAASAALPPPPPPPPQSPSQQHHHHQQQQQQNGAALPSHHAQQQQQQRQVIFVAVAVIAVLFVAIYALWPAGGFGGAAPQTPEEAARLKEMQRLRQEQARRDIEVERLPYSDAETMLDSMRLDALRHTRTGGHARESAQASPKPATGSREAALRALDSLFGIAQPDPHQGHHHAQHGSEPHEEHDHTPRESRPSSSPSAPTPDAKPPPSSTAATAVTASAAIDKRASGAHGHVDPSEAIAIPSQCEAPTSYFYRRSTPARCDLKYGFPNMDAWRDTMETMCGDDSLAEASTVAKPSTLGEVHSSLQCASTVLDYLRPATRPHAFCEAHNIVLRMPLLQQRQSCLKHRPGYKCESPDFHVFQDGSVAGHCDMHAAFSLEKFSRDHLRDIFDGFRGLPSGDAESVAIDEVYEGVTLFVTRETGEHANMFHAMSDHLNLFEMLYMFKIHPCQARVVILDEHSTGPYDHFYKHAAAPCMQVMRPSDFSAQSTILFRRAVFVPPGYTNLLLGPDDQDDECDHEVDLLASYREYFLSGFGMFPKQSPDVAFTSADLLQPYEARSHYPNSRIALPGKVECVARDGTVGTTSDDGALCQSAEAGGASAPLGAGRDGERFLITLIARRPYNKFVEHSFMQRRISNEKELLLGVHRDALKQFPELNVVVVMVDFAQYDFEDQVRIAGASDILAGMHGAALALAMYLPSTSAMIELLPRKDRDYWPCYQHIAGWRSLVRERWFNTDMSRHQQLGDGDTTEVDVDAISEVIHRLSLQVLDRKARFAADQFN